MPLSKVVLGGSIVSAHDLTSLTAEIDSLLIDVAQTSPKPKILRAGSSRMNARLSKLQSAARRVQTDRDGDFEQPTAVEFALARRVLESTPVPLSWRLGVMPAGDGGLELRFVDGDNGTTYRSHLRLTNWPPLLCLVEGSTASTSTAWRISSLGLGIGFDGSPQP